jgi:hypothetical protein
MVGMAPSCAATQPGHDGATSDCYPWRCWNVDVALLCLLLRVHWWVGPASGLACFTTRLSSPPFVMLPIVLTPK